MSVEQYLRTIAVLTCMYTVGLFVTSLTIATMNVAGYSTAVVCGPGTCTHTSGVAVAAAASEPDAVTAVGLALAQAF